MIWYPQLKRTPRNYGMSTTETDSIIEVWCNGSIPAMEVGVMVIDAREEDHGVTLSKHPETYILGDGCLFVSNATRSKNAQSALWNSLVTVEVRLLLLQQIRHQVAPGCSYQGITLGLRITRVRPIRNPVHGEVVELVDYGGLENR